MDEPRSCHLLAVKRIPRYIKNIANHEILMPNQKNSRREAHAYANSRSNWGGDQNDMKSSVDYLFMIEEG